MDRSEIEHLIDKKITEHEIRFTLAGLATAGLVALIAFVLQ